MSEPRITARLDAPAELSEPIKQGLKAYNESHVGDAPMHSLVLLAYDAEERVVGGLLGLLQVGWLFIDSLWVDERHRHAGLGTKLLRRTEELALEQGIHRARLNTTSWQARGFYEKAVGLSATGSQAVSRCTAGVTPRPHARAPGGTLEA